MKVGNFIQYAKIESRIIIKLYMIIYFIEEKKKEISGVIASLTSLQESTMTTGEQCLNHAFTTKHPRENHLCLGLSLY